MQGKIIEKKLLQYFFCEDVKIMTSIAGHHHFFILVPEDDPLFYVCLKNIFGCSLGLWPIKPEHDQNSLSDSKEINSYSSWEYPFNQEKIINNGLIGIGKARSEEAILLNSKLIDQNISALQEANILNIWTSPNGSVYNNLFDGYVFIKRYDQILSKIDWFVAFSNIIETILFVTSVDKNKIDKLILECKKSKIPLFWLSTTSFYQFSMEFDCDESKVAIIEYLKALKI